MHRTLYLIEYENGWPPVVVQRLFLTGLQSHLKDPQMLVFENDFVVGGRRSHGIHCRIPSRGVRSGTIIRHDNLPSASLTQPKINIAFL